MSPQSLKNHGTDESSAVGPDTVRVDNYAVKYLRLLELAKLFGYQQVVYGGHVILLK